MRLHEEFFFFFRPRHSTPFLVQHDQLSLAAMGEAIIITNILLVFFTFLALYLQAKAACVACGPF